MEEKIEKPKNKKTLLLVLLGIVLIGLIWLGYFVLDKERREDALSFIDTILLSNEASLDKTEDFEKQLPNLSEDFLDSETVSTEEIDDSLEDLDTQINALDDLDSDFELEDTDVGL